MGEGEKLSSSYYKAKEGVRAFFSICGSSTLPRHAAAPLCSGSATYVYLLPLWPLSERVFITATTRGGGGEGGWHLVLRNGPEFGPTPTSRDVPCAAEEEEKRWEEKVIEAANRGKNSPRHFVHRQKDILPSFWPPEKVKFNEVPFSFFSFTESFA